MKRSRVWHAHKTGSSGIEKHFVSLDGQNFGEAHYEPDPEGKDDAFIVSALKRSPWHFTTGREYLVENNFKIEAPIEGEKGEPT